MGIYRRLRLHRIHREVRRINSANNVIRKGIKGMAVGVQPTRRVKQKGRLTLADAKELVINVEVNELNLEKLAEDCKPL